MLTHEKIVDAVKKAASIFPLKKAEYFGSYANGVATGKSDLDILVEFMEPAISILTIIELKYYLVKELAIPVDVVHAPIPPSALIEIDRTVKII